MKRYNILFLLFLCASIHAAAQTISPDTLAARLWQQAFAFPQERLYTQTDRASYVAGDTIWMRHHVVDALTGIPALASRYVYVELVSPMGGVVRRVMMRQDERGAIYGYLPTDVDMPSGEYMLRAYTRYMADCTPDYIFSRQLRLRNVMANSVKIDSEYRGGTLMLSFTDPTTGKPIHRGSVRVVSSAEGKEVAFTGNTDEGVKIHAADVGSRQRSLLVEVGNYSEYVAVARQRIDVQIMPEGGNLVMGQRCRVAYKAVAATGLGVDVAATVTDDRGSMVAESAASHLGMGMFYIVPQPGRSYRLECTAPDGQTVVKALPEARADVPSLSVAQNSSSVMVSVVSPQAFAAQGRMWIVVHQGGAPLYVQPVGEGLMRFDRKSFRDGIADILLVDGNANVVSERLCFVWNGGDVCSPANVVAAQPGGGKMQRLDVRLPDSVTADCAVSITADGMDTVQNIVSSLLLSQELRGYVEQPAWYFAGRGRSGQLDLLMLTQGWRRYDVPAALKGGVRLPNASPETSMSLSGKVTSNVTAAGRKGSSVVMSSNRGGLADATTTDSDGRFRFDGFEMPDSTGYMLMTRSAKGSTNSVLRMDDVIFPDVQGGVPQQHGAAERGSAADARKDADRMAVAHGGRVTFLPEVEVVATRKPKTEFEMMAKMGGVSITEDELMKEGGKSLFDRLKGDMSLGLLYNSGKDWFMYHNRPTLLIVDGTLWNAGGTSLDSMSLYQAQKTFLMSIRAKDVLQVDVLKGLAVGTLPIVSADITSIGMDMSAIAVTTKSTTGSVNSHIAFLRPLGYQRPAAFYNPQFEAPEGYELRQTVYWNPSLAVEGGKATLQFLPNGAGEYHVKVEGVSSKGKIVSMEKTVVRSSFP